MAQVELEVEVLVVDPRRVAEDGDAREALAIARAGGDGRGQKAAQAREVDGAVRIDERPALEDGERADVHVRGRPLDGEEGRVQRREPLRVCRSIRAHVVWLAPLFRCTSSCGKGRVIPA